METMNIALPQNLREYVRRRVQQGGYGSVSEYVRELIRLDQRQAAQDILEAELLKGLASGSAGEMTSEDWARLRRQVRRQAKGRKTR